MPSSSSSPSGAPPDRTDRSDRSDRSDHTPVARRLARGDFAAYALFLLLACVLLWPVVLKGEVLLPAQYLQAFYPWRAEQPQPEGIPPWNALLADSVLQYLPWRHFMRESLHAGFLPLWNPHQLCGTPLVANYQSALFYPPNLLFWILPAAYAFGWSAVLHLFLAGAFFYVFLRGRGLSRTAAAVGGVTFELCGVLVAWLELPTAVNVAVWLPLALHLYERGRAGAGWRRGLPAALPLAMILLAGHPQFALYTLYAFVGYAVVHLPEGANARERLAGAVACIGAPLALAGLLAAPQVLPMMEFSRMSHRGGASALTPNSGSYRLQALPFWASVVLLMPGFFGSPAHGDHWGLVLANYAEFVGYAGVLPVLLALAAILGLALPASRRAWREALPPGSARRVAFFAALAVVAVAASFRTPLGVIFHSLAPGLGNFGSPARLLLLYCVALAALAGYGAQGMQNAECRMQNPGGPARPPFRILHSAFCITVLWGLGSAWAAAVGASVMGAGSPGQVLLAQSDQVLRFLALLVVGALVLRLAATHRHAPPAFSILHSAFCIRQLAVVGLVAVDLLAAGWGFNPTAPAALVYPETAVTQALRALGPEARFLAVTPQWSLDRYPVAVLPPNGATALGLNDVNGYDSLYLMAYKDLLNRIAGGETSPPANGNMVLFGTYGAPAFRELGCRYVLSLKEIHAPGFTLLRDGPVKLYEAAKALPRAFVAATPEGEPVAGARADWATMAATRAAARVDAPAGGYLVALDTLYPGWRATVDGRPAPVERVRRVFRAVRVPAGRHQVGFRYEPAAFRFGLFLGLLGVAIAGAAVGFAGARRFRDIVCD